MGGTGEQIHSTDSLEEEDLEAEEINDFPIRINFIQRETSIEESKTDAASDV